jgi:2-oxoglutarate dehydrogenase complex dehydrogenase (E1) component-like enzyme
VNTQAQKDRNARKRAKLKGKNLNRVDRFLRPLSFVVINNPIVAQLALDEYGVLDLDYVVDLTNKGNVIFETVVVKGEARIDDIILELQKKYCGQFDIDYLDVVVKYLPNGFPVTPYDGNYARA